VCVFTAYSPHSLSGYGHKRSGSFAARPSLPLTHSYDEQSFKLAFSSAGKFADMVCVLHSTTAGRISGINFKRFAAMSF